MAKCEKERAAIGKARDKHSRGRALGRFAKCKANKKKE